MPRPQFRMIMLFIIRAIEGRTSMKHNPSRDVVPYSEAVDITTVDEPVELDGRLIDSWLQGLPEQPSVPTDVRLETYSTALERGCAIYPLLICKTMSVTSYRVRRTHQEHAPLPLSRACTSVFLRVGTSRSTPLVYGVLLRSKRP